MTRLGHWLSPNKLSWKTGQDGRASGHAMPDPTTSAWVSWMDPRTQAAVIGWMG